MLCPLTSMADLKRAEEMGRGLECVQRIREAGRKGNMLLPVFLPSWRNDGFGPRAFKGLFRDELAVQVSSLKPSSPKPRCFSSLQNHVAFHRSVGSTISYDVSVKMDAENGCKNGCDFSPVKIVRRFPPTSCDFLSRIRRPDLSPGFANRLILWMVLLLSGDGLRVDAILMV